MGIVTLNEMLEAGVHFGHQTRRWSPKMRPYIFTARNGIHIIDLTQTAVYLEKAYAYLKGEADRGKKILFVGTKRQASTVIAQEASRCGMYYINQRWLGGMLTNWATIRSRVDRLKDLRTMQKNGLFDRLPKKEAATRRKELERLEKYLGGIKDMRRLPDILLIVDQRREYNAIMEARRLGIPIVSLLDTNCDPEMVDVGVPANDDAIRSIKLIVGRLADAILEGRRGAVEAPEEPEAPTAETPEQEMIFDRRATMIPGLDTDEEEE
ncbi:30S ribosomal protein S2 [Anthocerotibacter panamensis]|uniref:30S ribosomal protein S2 n=1 Tax=Anthocerotibacter panamensis TaxID=2857077 RepID=UPI001C40166B|nr:30S ribosomal protein S2 [Anthocerotibacter panamensis]